MTPALGVALLVAAAQAAAQGPVGLEVLSTAALAAPKLVESSGAATSALVPGLVWTLNDSGDGPFLYATDAEGHDLGRVRVDGAVAVDWEELSAGPCLVAPGRCLYVGDIGDNRGHRDHVVVYRLREPPPPRGPADTLGSAPLLDSLVLRYPDHPHDAEALVVTADGTMLVISKDLFGPAVVFSASSHGGPPARRLARVGLLDLQTGLLAGRLVTGAALSPGDSVLVVRTYVSLHFFRLDPGSVPVPLGPRAGITIPLVEPQGEGVAFDGPDRLILTSERGEAAQGTITRLRVVRPGDAPGVRTH